MPNLTPLARKLRKNATRAEQHLWYEHLRYCTPKIRRQHVLANFILDFYCTKLRLGIELDGAHHYTPEGRAKDTARTEILNAHAITIIRFENKTILEELQTVIQALEALGIKRNTHPSDASLRS